MGKWTSIEISRDGTTWDAVAMAANTTDYRSSEKDEFNILADEVTQFAEVHGIDDIRLILGDD